jgi:hypothetical protein
VDLSPIHESRRKSQPTSFPHAKTLSETSEEELPIEMLRFIAAADLVQLDTAALRHESRRKSQPTSFPHAKTLSETSEEELPIEMLRFIAAADLVGLDTAALRHGSR